MSSGVSLGIGLLVSGLLLVVLVWGLLRLLPAVSAAATRRELAIPAGPDQSEDAVVLIEPGGRVAILNARAREWFALQENAPIDLERLLRGVRPADDFLALCAAPGQKRLNVNGRPVEAASHQIPGTQAQMLISMGAAEVLPSIAAGGEGLPTSSLEIITDFTSSIASSLDLETVLRSMADGMLRLVAADILEIKILDQATARLCCLSIRGAKRNRPEAGPGCAEPIWLSQRRRSRNPQASSLARCRRAGGCPAGRKHVHPDILRCDAAHRGRGTGWHHRGRPDHE